MSVALPDRSAWWFSLRTFAAAMLALYIGFLFALDRPYWAMASVYIASQPLSGATRSKAAYRATGTVLGAVAAVALVPNLVNAPLILVLAIALWIGACLYLALLDRSPRSYVFMLAGYTAGIIGFPSVAAPDGIFLVAVSRVEEIVLGIVCAAVMASVVFPRRVQPALERQVEDWLHNAARWALAALAGESASQPQLVQRQRLAADLAEIDMLTSFLAWDPAAAPDAMRTLRALRRRMLTMLPVLSSLTDRVQALREEGGLAPVEPALAAMRDWLNDRHAVYAPPGLREMTAPHLPHDARWSDMLRVTLLHRLRELIDVVEDCRRLRQHFGAGGPFPAPLAYASSRAVVSVTLVDRGRALWSAASAALAVAIVCWFWIATAWADGAGAATLTAVGASFFAALDDPVPAIVKFTLWAAVAILADAVILFVFLPAISDFPMLVLSLTPFLLFATLTANPKTAPIGMALTAIGTSLLSLQSTYNAQFVPFVNSGVGLVVGMGGAALVTAVVRSVGAEWSAMRLLRQGWVDLADAAERRGRGDRARFAGKMLDRLGLLAPRLAVAAPGSDLSAVDVLADLRIGLNIVTLRRVRRRLPEPVREPVEAVLHEIGLYYRARAARQTTDPERVRARIDAALAAASESGRAAALFALVGMRRGLFPTAPGFVRPPPAAAAA